MGKRGEVAIIFGILFLVILVAAIYLFNQSGITGNVVSSTNLISNGDFSNGLTSWNVVNVNTIPAIPSPKVLNGYATLYGYEYILQEFDAQTGVTYNLTFTAGGQTPMVHPYATIQNSTWASIIFVYLDTSSGTVRNYTAIFTVPADGRYKVTLANSPEDINKSFFSIFDNVVLNTFQSPGQSCGSNDECSTGICGAYNSNSGNVCLNGCSIPTDCSNINQSDACVYGKCVQGKVVKLLARDVEISSCEGGLTITCTTDLGTDSIEPWWNFTGNLLDFNQGIVDGKSVSTFLVNISNSASGVYGAGCFLNADWSRGYTDLNVPATKTANPSLLNISNYNIPSCGVNSNFIIEGQNVYPSNTGQKSNATSQCSDLILKVTNSSGNVKNFTFNKSISSVQTYGVNIPSVSSTDALNISLSNSCCLNKDFLGQCKSGYMNLKVVSVKLNGEDFDLGWELRETSQFIPFKGEDSDWNLDNGNCIDGDGGLRSETKGTTYKNSVVNYTDTCLSYSSTAGFSNVSSCTGDNCYVKEYYCESNTEELFNKPLKCSNGCSLGACTSSGSVNNVVTCTSPDGTTVSPGARLDLSSLYCGDDGILSTFKAKGATCINSYECSSDNCVASKCVDVSATNLGSNNADSNIPDSTSDNTSSTTGEKLFWIIFIIVLVLGIVLTFVLMALYKKKNSNLGKKFDSSNKNFGGFGGGLPPRSGPSSLLNSMTRPVNRPVNNVGVGLVRR
ncbi:MAG: hypothetical protein AABX48_02770 [Nanoarchaeota archaeon]